MTMESLGTILRRIAARDTWITTGDATDTYPGNRAPATPQTTNRGRNAA